MFQEWGFLITEMLFLLVLAALLGLLVGWIIWGRGSGGNSAAEADLAQCRKRGADLEAKLEAAQKQAESAREAGATSAAELAQAQARIEAAEQEAASARADAKRAEVAANAAAMAAPTAAASTMAVGAALADHADDAADDAASDVAAAAQEASEDVSDMAQAASTADADSAAEAAQDAIPDYDGDGILEGAEEGTRPEALSGAREGGADDLKRIKGVGPKLEQLCNTLGFYHFDQIANWSADEVAWVDANLAGFKGRVSRDNWVEQARILAEGGETEFSKRVDDGDMY